MFERRMFLLAGLGAMPLLTAVPALADTNGDRAIAFIKSTSDMILGAMRRTGSTEERRKVLGPIIDKSLDVDGLARFCLGRFWRTATPDQQQRYTAVFHQVLIGNITAKLGEYQDVRLTIGRSKSQDDVEMVSSVVEHPNNPPTTVEWAVADAASDPKVIDVVAEGTSLRLTQRQDYASYLTHNDSNVDKLIDAMRQQLTQ